jgi:hypothetical protein
VEQKYSEIRRPVYLKRGDIIKTIPDFWLTAVCRLLCAIQMCLSAILLEVFMDACDSNLLCYVLLTYSF